MAFGRKILTPYEEYMNIVKNSLKTCNNKMTHCPNHANCNGTCKSNNFCIDCLNDILTNDTSLSSRLRNYNCDNITYSYVLRYLNRYASEIYKLFSKTQFIQRKQINLLSLGCGPATELIGFETAYHEQNPNGILNYFGFDSNNIWTNCQNIIQNIYSKSTNTNCNFSTTTLLSSNALLLNTDLLILNYMISHIHKHQNTNDKSVRNQAVSTYLDSELTPIFDAMPSDSILLINDTNSYNLGRNQIENWARKQSAKVSSLITGIYPNPQKPYAKFNQNTTIMKDNDLTFPENKLYAPYSININCCGSAFVILKKK